MKSVLQDFEAMATALNANPDYRVLRRVRPRAIINPDDGAEKRLAVIVDTETTGLDTEKDEIISLAMAQVEYSPQTGKLYRVLDAFEEYREPSRPIPVEVTALTGITNEMVQGRSIDIERVLAMVMSSVLVIAHNADFDRRVLERFHPVFFDKGWACTHSDLPWADEQCGSSKLEYLACRYGFFHDGHRALNDVLAVVEMLAGPLPVSRGSTMLALLEAARRPSFRIQVFDAPFERKDLLKTERRFRWFPGSAALRKHWHKDVAESDLAEELAFLKSRVFERPVDIPVTRLTAKTRFSDHARGHAVDDGA